MSSNPGLERRSIRGSLRLRVAVAFAALAICTAAILAFAGYFQLQHHLDRTLERELNQLRQRLEHAYGDGGSGAMRRLRGQFVREATCSFFATLSQDGQLLGAAARNQGLPPTEALTGDAERIEFDGAWHRVSRKDLPGTDQLLVIGRPCGDADNVLRSYMSSLVPVFVLVLVFVIVVAWLVAGRAVRGVERVAAAAKRVGQGDLSVRVEHQNGGHEIDELVAMFNQMTTRVERLLQEQREITENIAHDLRTPITRIRGEAESMLRRPENAVDIAGAVVQDCDSLVQLINTTLEISQGETGALSLNKEELDLSRLAQMASELFEPLVERKHQRLTVGTTGPVRIRADKARLQRLVSNLLDNAIKFTPAHGNITIEVETCGDHACLHVQDSGPGIPEAEHENVFRRFYRCDNSRSIPGNGLGLSLVKAIAQAHGGSVGLESCDGLRVSVRLPIGRKITNP